MNLIPPSVQPFCGNPTRRPSGSDLHLVEDGLLVPRGVRDLAQFYSAPHCALQGNSIEALNISKMYLELDQVKHSELYIVDPTLSETDRDARLAEIKAHTTAIQREVIAHEATKKLANQPSAAHTYVISAISTHLRRLYQATTCPYELFEHIKTRFEFNPMENNPTVVASYLRTHEFTDDGCIGTLPQGIVLKVKSIAGHKFVPDVSDFMLEVFWEGFEDIESSWEPLKKLMREWPAMVKAYVAAKKNAEDHEILTKAMKRAIVAK
ncbi:hypothetical protein B5M09_000681 [Aphanomyces astaci]|uniref:Chromo domain-containing protein n=1 Tax=Aphanomyces astaci TaxID=112090 RepID=A0A425D1X8_APHAT|nr:hypothetical protein B5M09_000681 [Aphanomyces astaci]